MSSPAEAGPRPGPSSPEPSEGLLSHIPTRPPLPHLPAAPQCPGCQGAQGGPGHPARGRQSGSEGGEARALPAPLHAGLSPYPPSGALPHFTAEPLRLRGPGPPPSSKDPALPRRLLLPGAAPLCCSGGGLATPTALEGPQPPPRPVEEDRLPPGQWPWGSVAGTAGATVSRSQPFQPAAGLPKTRASE